MLRLKAVALAACLVALPLLGCSDDGGGDHTPTDTGVADTGTDTGGDAQPDAQDDGGGGGTEPFAALETPVTVITDEYGMKHIYAERFDDLFYVNGYTYAADRFGQLEFFRRVARGTLGETLGGISEDAVETDVLMRTLGLKRNAEAKWQESYDPNNEAYQALEAFSAGVNAYIAQYRAGEVEQSAAVERLFPPEATPDWEPSDTLAMIKLSAVQLTYYAPMWIDAHDLRAEALATYAEDASQPALAARAGFFADVMRTAPSTETTHIDGFPTTGTAMTMPDRLAERPDVEAPSVSRRLIDNARNLHEGLADVPELAGLDLFNARGDLGKGSNNWVISGELTDSGNPHVANDPHLGLSLPTIFYPIHLELTGDPEHDDISVVGVAFMGAPGIVVGRNEHVAWGTTVGYYDYVDVYREQLSGPQTPGQGGGGVTASFDGSQVPLETITETIRIGSFGTITEEVELELEVVPHHGPIFPTVEAGRPVARTATEALSVKWVGLEGTNDMEFGSRLWRAQTPADIEEALDYWQVGSSNWVFGFTSGDIFYSGQSDIPVRSAGAMTYDPVANPEGTAPIFILPGDGSAEWEGMLDDAHIPHALNPDKGYVITANNDQVGTTLDNNPFNDTHYLGGFYDIGFRAERIEELFAERTAGGAKLTLADSTAIQDDGMDRVGQRIAPHIVDAVDRALDQTVDDTDDPELAALRAEVAGRETGLAQMRDLLAGWDYVAPQTRTPSGAEQQSSAAATLFNVAMVYLLRDVFADEFTEIGYYDDGFTLPQREQILVRSLIYLLEEADTAQTFDAEVGDSAIFDDMTTPDLTETRQTMLVRALLKAQERLRSGLPLGNRFAREIPSPASADPADWVWGDVHGLRLDAMFPLEQEPYRRPATGLPFYPRQGGMFAVTPCDGGLDDFDFTCASGSSLRMVHDMDPSGPVTYNAQPGGPSGDPSSPYFDSEIDIWQSAQPRKLETDRAALESSADDVTVYGQ